MFAYCLNNPVVLEDASGAAAKTCISAEGRIDDAPWRDYSPSGGGIIYKYESNLDYSTDKFLTVILLKYLFNSNEAVVQQQLKTYGVSFYKGVPVCMTELLPDGSAFSLGIIVMDGYYKTASASDFSSVLKHEYGHRVHMDQIGVPAYLATVAVPSLAGAALSYVSPFVYNNYESLPWENIAEQLGDVNGTYLPGAEAAASVYWVYTLYISQILYVVWGG